MGPLLNVPVIEVSLFQKFHVYTCQYKGQLEISNYNMIVGLDYIAVDGICSAETKETKCSI